MNRKHIITIASLFLVLLCSVIGFLKFSERNAVMKDKVLAYIPANTEWIANISNPETVFHKNISQNDVWKNFNSNVFKTLNELISTINYWLSENESLSKHIQNGSYYLIKTPTDALICFTAIETKDIDILQTFLDNLSKKNAIYYQIIDGNFFISKNQPIHLTENNIHKNTLNLFNSLKKTDRSILLSTLTDKQNKVYQINFTPTNITINGFLILQKEISEYALGVSQNIIKDFSFVEIKPLDTLSIITQKLQTLDSIEYEKGYSLRKEILNSIIKKILITPKGFLAPLKNTETIQDNLKVISDTFFVQNECSVFKIKDVFKIDLNRLFNNPLKENFLYFILSDKYLIGCSLPDSSNIQLYKYITNNPTYTYFFYQSNLTFYNELPDIVKSMHELQFDTKYPYEISFVMETPKNNYQSFYYSINLNTNRENYLWSRSTTLPVKKIIGIFQDHKTFSNQILIQDSSFAVSLLSALGEPLWTYAVNSSIISSLYNVDILKNNKHQMIFNTEKSIYLLDRNGKNIGNFPLQLPSEATNGLTVADYENTKNYRLFISTQKHFTFNYDVNAHLAEGFKPFLSDKIIQKNIQYVKVGASDYLILTDIGGTIYGISRKGDGRFKLKNKIPKNTFDNIIDVSNTIEKSYLYNCNTENVQRISFSDKVAEIYRMPDNTIDAKFIISSINQKITIAILLDNKLTIQSIKGDVIKNIPLSQAYKHIILYQSKSTQYIMLEDGKEYKLIAIDINGEITDINRKIQSDCTPLISALFDKDDYIIYYSNTKLVVEKIASQ